MIAGAIAGNLFVDLASQPLGQDRAGAPVHLSDIWPSAAEIAEVLEAHGGQSSTVDPGGDVDWHALEAPTTPQFPWRDGSTFLRQPPFFNTTTVQHDKPDIVDARALLVLGDDVTTDHISPIGRIAPQSPAGRWLLERGVGEHSLGGYGDRRANHHVMLRGTFDNPRLVNRLAQQPGNSAPMQDGAFGAIFDAAMLHAGQGRALIIVAGRNYGTGSARDWAAKGTALLGVRAVLARSFERIHRANLIAMGVAPIVVAEDFPDPASDDLISLSGLDTATMDQGEVIIGVGQADGIRLRYSGHLDVRSDSQIAMLRDGGLFAGLRRRFETR